MDAGIGRILDALEAAGIPFTELSDVQANPRSGKVYEGIDLVRRTGADFLLAVGGGSVIDTAKAIAIGVPYDGDFWDFFSGKMPEQALPVGTVLTIAASGSEGSPDSIITNEKTLEKNGAEADCLRPCFSVLDPALTESLPAYQTACGITDIMAHTFERYFTNTPDVEVTDRMLEGVLLAMLHEGRRVMEDPHNYEARANIMWAGMVCHNDIMGVGRQQDWNSHHLEHVLSAKYDCAHGAGLAVIMPAWMRYCAEHGGEKRLAQMAVRVFGCQMDFDDPKRTALEGIEAFRAFLRSIGMPLTFAEIGADPADIPELVEMNHIGDGKTGGYILGYILCALIVGALSPKFAFNFKTLCLSMVLGVAVCYAFGTIWFMAVTGLNLATSMSYCVIPFLPGDVVKILLAAFLALRLRKPLAAQGFAA